MSQSPVATTDSDKLRRIPIHKRDYISVSKIDHKSSTPVTATTDPFTLFADAGACMLMPAVDQGPLCMLRHNSRRINGPTY